MPLQNPVEVECNNCNGNYNYDGKQVDPNENKGTNCPYCGEMNLFSLHIKEKYGN